MSSLTLAFELQFADLYHRDGLLKLDAAFVADLASRNRDLHDRFLAARGAPDAAAEKETADLLIALAAEVDDFIGRLFGIGDAVSALRARHSDLAPLYTVKRLFVQRRAAKAVPAAELPTLDGSALAVDLARRFGAPFAGPDDELTYARRVDGWMKDEAAHAADLDIAARYAAWALSSEAGRALHARGVLFKQPKKLDPEHLVALTVDESRGYRAFTLDPHHWRHREGFSLTDCGTDLKGALDQANYCIWCHSQGKDSCSKGLRDKVKGVDKGPFKKNQFGITLAGCPLEERISEMHAVKVEGFALGALAMIAIDNPLCAATGHRICNDCMKACIYQKQDPVNIPEVETRILKDVLDLPWGFEIYALLTRWNPLNLHRPLPLADTGRKVLIAGLGPAGYSLAHHLLNDGHAVFGIDGLKIEPLAAELSGVTVKGERVPFQPIADVNTLYEDLNDRAMAGFGGVAEYGITVRWNKNYLKIIRLLLERRSQIAMTGGVRFGGGIGIDDAFAAGFDHIALAMGAGRPTVLDMPNGLARGVRTASDFLMALQLTGAAKTDSIANMQLRLPAVVIGGGLTAIDTATEAMAYYPVQVEKFLTRYETLAAERGAAAVRARWSAEEAEIADEFIAHAQAIRAERQTAAAAGRQPRLIDLLRGWGGVTMAYRKRLIDSPSYTLNHEEVEKALEEGIYIAEGLSPAAVEVDDRGHVAAIRLNVEQRGDDGKWTRHGAVTLPARAVLVAAGTQPNTVLAREDGRITVDGKYFQAYDESGAKVAPERLSKPDRVEVLVHVRDDGRTVSYFGDLHPSFAGNVVKAMGGAKQGYPAVSRMLAKVTPATAEGAAAFLARIGADFRAEVVEINRLTPNIVEVVVKAPAAARAFQPGQFFRLQNFEALAPKVGETRLAMEGLALTGAWTDPAKGYLGMIVLEMGGSSDLCATLKPGEPVIVMGPTGAPTEIEPNETVLLVGGGLGNAVLFSIGQAMRAAGNKVLYVAGYKKVMDRYKVEEIERAADVVVWACDEAPGFALTRPGDATFVGNIVQAIEAYGSGALGEVKIRLEDVDRIIAIGSDKMMAAVGAARHGILAPRLKKSHLAIGSINSPMQCMMKEICAQCIQPHIDPETGEKSHVFSCFNQDQPLDRVDFAGLDQRLKQNAVQEKLTAQWLDRCLKTAGLRKPAA